MHLAALQAMILRHFELMICSRCTEARLGHSRDLEVTVQVVTAQRQGNMHVSIAELHETLGQAYLNSLSSSMTWTPCW